MIKKIFTVFDEKSAAFLQPFFLDTTGQAIRAITDCVTDPQHQFGRHPADYTLFYLGEFDDQTAIFTQDKKPLGCLIEFKPVSIDRDALTPLRLVENKEN